MDSSQLRQEKLEPRLRSLLSESDPSQRIPVIVQTFLGTTPELLDNVRLWQGVVRDQLKIIKGFSADLPPQAIEALILSDQIKAISYDAPVRGGF